MADCLTTQRRGITTDVRVTGHRLRRELAQVLHCDDECANLDFYISALTEYNPYHTTTELQEWLQTLCQRQVFEIQSVPLGELRQWRFDGLSGDLVHKSGRFFSIRGIHVRTNLGAVDEWSQPIIHQPEIGILGIVTKKIGGILYFLMQAKAEPGNINTYQLSPTVQATRSNYTCVHGGDCAPYVELFLKAHASQVLVDQLQSEQGARFYRKRNRNIIIRVPDDLEIDETENHRWMTLGQILALAQHDNTVNMDTRSVIAGIDFCPQHSRDDGTLDEEALRDCLERSPLVTKPVREFGIKLAVSGHPASRTQHNTGDLLRRITMAKFDTQLDANLIPLNDVRGWKRDPMEIAHKDGKYFRGKGTST